MLCDYHRPKNDIDQVVNYWSCKSMLQSVCSTMYDITLDLAQLFTTCKAHVKVVRLFAAAKRLNRPFLETLKYSYRVLHHIVANSRANPITILTHRFSKLIPCLGYGYFSNLTAITPVGFLPTTVGILEL